MLTALYRHYDVKDTLLYVGVSLCAIARLSQHKTNSDWYNKIIRVSIEWLPTREIALIAETKAIRVEKPLHNVKKVPKEKEIEEHATARTRHTMGLSRIDACRHDIVRRLVYMEPTYTLTSAANVLNISTSKLKALINAKELSCIYIGNKRLITGWHLLDYISYLETK